MKWQKVIQLTFDIVLVDGARIGGAGGGLEIGSAVEANLAVLRNPANGEPYIPGSSLKGKLRSTLEKEYGLGNKGEPCSCGKKECMVCTIFGAHKNTKAESAPTRVVIRDAGFTTEYRRQFNDALQQGKPVLEEKTENTVNRKSGTALNPRTGERLLPGACFGAEILLHVYDGDPAERFAREIRHALAVVQNFSALGASGSRGYGRVKFENLNEETLALSDAVL